MLPTIVLSTVINSVLRLYKRKNSLMYNYARSYRLELFIELYYFFLFLMYADQTQSYSVTICKIFNTILYKKKICLINIIKNRTFFLKHTH